MMNETDRNELENDKKKKRRQVDMRSMTYLRTFLQWTFTMAWILQAYASLRYMQGDAFTYIVMLGISMFTPMVAIAAAGGRLKGIGWKFDLRGKFIPFLIAWFLPAILGAIGAALYFLILPGRLDLSGTYIKAVLGDELLAQFAAMGLSPQDYIVIALVQSVTLAPFINMLLAVGEEAGWRGVMYPALKEKCGTVAGRIIGGIIWGIWHWPIMIMTGYEYGSDYPGAPVAGLILFCLFCVALGVMTDHLYERTECIWIPALFHGAVNAFASVPILVQGINYSNEQILGPTMIGIVGGLPLLICAGLTLYFNRSTAIMEYHPLKK